MDRLWGALVCIVVIAAVFAGMALAWRGRRRRQAGLDGIRPVPADAGGLVAVAEGLYLATTRLGQPLERIAAGGLGFRARSSVEVREHGLVLALDGVPERWIPAADLRGAGRATWTIDRTVEPGGLTVVRWVLNGEELESSFRVDEPGGASGPAADASSGTPASDSAALVAAADSAALIAAADSAALIAAADSAALIAAVDRLAAERESA